MDNNIEDIKEAILTTLSFGAKVTLPNGITLNKTLNNDIVYEFKDNIKKISERDTIEILDNIKFWKMKNGRYIEVNRMATSHITNTINHQQKKLDFIRSHGGYDDHVDIVENTINMLTQVLRDRNIQEILDEEENYGLDNISV